MSAERRNLAIKEALTSQGLPSFVSSVVSIFLDDPVERNLVYVDVPGTRTARPFALYPEPVEIKKGVSYYLALGCDDSVYQPEMHTNVRLQVQPLYKDRYGKWTFASNWSNKKRLFFSMRSQGFIGENTVQDKVQEEWFQDVCQMFDNAPTFPNIHLWIIIIYEFMNFLRFQVSQSQSQSESMGEPFLDKLAPLSAHSTFSPF